MLLGLLGLSTLSCPVSTGRHQRTGWRLRPGVWVGKTWLWPWIKHVKIQHAESHHSQILGFLLYQMYQSSKVFGCPNFVYFDWYPCVRDIGHPNGRPQKSIQQPSTWPSQTRRPRAIQEDFRSSFITGPNMGTYGTMELHFLHCFSCILTKWSK